VALPAVSVGCLGEPLAVHAHVARVFASRAVRQRPAGEPALEQLRHLGELDRVAHQAGEPLCRRGRSPFVLPHGPRLSPQSAARRRQRAVSRHTEGETRVGIPRARQTPDRASDEARDPQAERVQRHAILTHGPIPATRSRPPAAHARQLTGPPLLASHEARRKSNGEERSHDEPFQGAAAALGVNSESELTTRRLQRAAAAAAPPPAFPRAERSEPRSGVS
jgi:hypothetical protein